MDISADYFFLLVKRENLPSSDHTSHIRDDGLPAACTLSTTLGASWGAGGRDGGDAASWGEGVEMEERGSSWKSCTSGKVVYVGPLLPQMT